MARKMTAGAEFLAIQAVELHLAEKLQWLLPSGLLGL